MEFENYVAVKEENIDYEVEDDEEPGSFSMEKGFSSTEEGIVVLNLVREMLEYVGLEFTTSAFEAELSSRYVFVNRLQLAHDLNLDADKKGPLISQILHASKLVSATTASSQRDVCQPGSKSNPVEIETANNCQKTSSLIAFQQVIVKEEESISDDLEMTEMQSESTTFENGPIVESLSSNPQDPLSSTEDDFHPAPKKRSRRSESASLLQSLLEDPGSSPTQISDHINDRKSKKVSKENSRKRVLTRNTREEPVIDLCLDSPENNYDDECNEESSSNNHISKSLPEDGPEVSHGGSTDETFDWHQDPETDPLKEEDPLQEDKYNVDSSSLVSSFPTSSYMSLNEENEEPTRVPDCEVKEYDLKLLKCEFCNRYFPTMKMLDNHRKDEHGNLLRELYREIRPKVDIHRCKYCDESLTSSEDLALHQKVVHSDLVLEGKDEDFSDLIVFPCKICDRTFENLKGLDYHQRQVHWHHCRTCNNSFETNEELIHHFNSTHRNTVIYACNICEKLCSSNSALLAHKKSAHNVNNVYKCEICGKPFKLLEFLIRHKKSVHSLFYQCNICGKGFRLKSLFEEHLNNVHNNEQQFAVLKVVAQENAQD